MGSGLGKARPGKSGIVLERKSEARAWDLVLRGWKKRVVVALVRGRGVAGP